jgi:hypothetical protein
VIKIRHQSNLKNCEKNALMFVIRNKSPHITFHLPSFIFFRALQSAHPGFRGNSGQKKTSGLRGLAQQSYFAQDYEPSTKTQGGQGGQGGPERIIIRIIFDEKVTEIKIKIK